MRRLLILLAGFVIGCKKEAEIPVTKASVKDAIINTPPSLVKKIECDSEFDSFFAKFQNDSVFQKNHIKFPLKNRHLDDDYHGMVRDDITFDEYRFMDFKSDKDAMKREYDKYTVEVQKRKDTVGYLLRGYDNGIYIEVKFAFENNCWYLVAIEDGST